MKIKSNFVKSIFITSLMFLFAFTANAEFDPDKLIEDKVFSDIKTFGGPEGIQKFLESKNSVLANTSPSFLVKLKEPQSTLLKQQLDDPNPNLGRLRTAAEIIWDAGIQSGLNPQVILVTLNKEQGLITSAKNYDEKKLQKALDRAMGFDCPDSTGCGNLFPGFYFQIFGNVDSEGNRYLGAARSLMKSFSTPQGRGPGVDSEGTVWGQVGTTRTSRVGDTIKIPNTQGPPYNAPEFSIVNIKNYATAALYRYTPHVYNGNYNFWKFFQEWFRYLNGTIINITGDTKNYIIQDGTKRFLPDFVALARGMNLSGKITVSPSEVSDYPEGKPFGPNDNTIVKIENLDKKFVFLDSIKRPVSDFVLKQRGLNPEQYLVMNAAEDNLFETGAQLPPKDGTTIKAKSSPAIYLTQNGKVKLFSALTYGQYKNPKPVIVEDSELSSYAKEGFVAPKDGTLIKANSGQAVYLSQSGLKLPLTGELFKNRGFSIKNINVVSKEELEGLETGDFATPKDRTFFAIGSKSGPIYIFKEGAKHTISSFVAKQRGITPDYIFGKSEAEAWSDGIAIPPKDGTVVKSSSSATVYLVSKGQLRPLTATAFKNRKIKQKSVVVLPADEIDNYAKGETLVK